MTQTKKDVNIVYFGEHMSNLQIYAVAGNLHLQNNIRLLTHTTKTYRKDHAVIC